MTREEARANYQKSQMCKHITSLGKSTLKEQKASAEDINLIGSPEEVIEKTLTFQEGFGDYQRQLWVVDHAGLPLEEALEQVELLGTEVVPVLRQELDSRRKPGVPDAPTHASRVLAKYGDAEPRQPRPNPNRGDNVTGTSPYQDTDPSIVADLPLVA